MKDDTAPTAVPERRTDDPVPGATWASAARMVFGDRTFVFLSCVSASFLLLFLRSPDAYLHPILFAEDGVTYVGPLLCQGFWPTLAGARGDYLVFGNIVLTWLATLVCKVAYGGDVLELPRALAIVSYLFFATIVSLPILIMRRRVALPALLLLWLLSTFVPLGVTDNEILGRMANVGFVFLYAAFLLVWYRNQEARSLAAFVMTDLGLLCCIATNPLSFAILPLTVWPYLRAWAIERRPLRSVVRSGSFLSLMTLGALSGLPLAWIISGASEVRTGPALTLHGAVEMGLARNILYPLVHPIYTHLNTDRSIFLTILVVAAFVRYGRRRHGSLYLAGAYLLGVSSLAMLVTRPELRACLTNYGAIPSPLGPAFPDRYYMGQNLIGILLIVVFLTDLFAEPKAPRWVRALAVFALAGSLWALPSQSTFGRPPGPHRFVEIGDFRAAADAAMAAGRFIDREGRTDPRGRYLRIDTYPTVWNPTRSIVFPRRKVEASLARADRASGRQSIAVRPRAEGMSRERPGAIRR